MARLGPFTVFTVALTLTVGAGVARAAPRVAVMPMEFEGRVPEVSRVSLNERLVEGLATAGFEVSAGDVLENALPKGTPPDLCHAAPCYKQLAKQLALNFLVIAQLKIKERNYELKLRLVSGRDGKLTAEERDTCELCGLQEVGEKLDKLASSLMSHAGGRNDPARLMVQSQPPGASVTVDGRQAGETPVSVELPAGPHEVAFAAQGYAGSHKKVTLDPGVRGLLSVELLPMPAAPGFIKARGPARELGVLSLGVGLAAVATGIAVLFVADHKATLCPGQKILPPPNDKSASHCYQNARLPAGILIGAGGSALVSGGLILFIDWGRANPAERNPDAVHAWAISARGTF
jgi:hypothetical protein